MSRSDKDLISVEFEIYGKVQGVFFRKYTQKKGLDLGLRGWCKNTTTGTVIGVIEGPRNKIQLMQNWLEREGSPKSHITKAEFQNERAIQNHSFGTFAINK